MFKGLNNSIYLDAHFGGVLFFTDVYIDTIFKVAGGFSTGAQTAVDTWTQQFWALANANMTTNGTITAIGNIYQQPTGTYRQPTGQSVANVSRHH